MAIGRSLVAQTLDIKANQAVVHIHIGGVRKRLQAAVGEYIQHQRQLLCAAQVGFVQISIQITERRAGCCVARGNQRFVNVFEAGSNQASVKADLVEKAKKPLEMMLSLPLVFEERLPVRFFPLTSSVSLSRESQ